MIERLRRWWASLDQHSIDKRDLWGRGMDYGDEVFAGVTVSQESALKLSVVWRCIRLISETLAGLPADAVRKQGDIRLEVDRPPRWLDQPNPEQTWFQFAERCFESQCMDGNAFVLITARDALGFPQELWTLHPREVEVRRDDEGPSGGLETYFVWGGQQALSRYTASRPTGDVLHIPLATGGHLRGMSPIEAARQAIGLGLVTEKFGSRFFGKGQTVSGVIQLPAASGPQTQEFITQMRNNWESIHAGSDKAHKPAVLTGGATWQSITIPPEDAQFLQTRSFQVEEIASRIYGIPSYLVGLTEKQTSWGTGVEQQGIGLVRYTLTGYISRFEQAMSQLLPRGQFLRLNPRALLRADSKTEAEVLAMELDRGVISFNEWRAILDQPPRPGGDGYMVPLNMQILSPGGKPPEPLPAPQTAPVTPVEGQPA